MIEKAKTLPVDQVFLDLEDSVAPLAKDAARQVVGQALAAGGWQGKTRAVRVNDLSTPWTYQDVISIVENAGSAIDCFILPKVAHADHVRWLDLLLTQLERAHNLDIGSIGIEAQIESAGGLIVVDAIAAASPRLESLIFGPADFMASVQMPGSTVGTLSPDYPGDRYHYALMRILVAARAYGLQAIDGPYLQIHDIVGFQAAARRSRALGFDGAWVLHPEQIETANATYTPSLDEYDTAEAVLTAYQHAASAAGGHRGAVMLGDAMIDEASRKMARVVAAKGRAAGLRRAP
jgi:citrate lyase subunit beta / citryl-CoA lyase